MRVTRGTWRSSVSRTSATANYILLHFTHKSTITTLMEYSFFLFFFSPFSKSTKNISTYLVSQPTRLFWTRDGFYVLRFVTGTPYRVSKPNDRIYRDVVTFGRHAVVIPDRWLICEFKSKLTSAVWNGTVQSPRPITHAPVQNGKRGRVHSVNTVQNGDFSF